MLSFRIDEERCTQCGQCVSDCPARCIVMAAGGYPEIPEEERCIRCQHCLAVCPTAALSILGADPDQSLPFDAAALPTAPSMERLIKGRRSTRQFKQQALDTQIIRKLLETARYAPTAVNAQSVLFTATMNRDATAALSKELYAKVEEMLAASNPEEDDFFHQYLRRFLAAYQKHGADGILRDAPHILIASAPKTAPQPKTDCIIALSYLDLLALTMGIGTVWNGILTRCITEFFPELAARLGVPADHEIGYCMSFGPPAVHYHRNVQRDSPAIQLIKSFPAQEMRR